MSKPDYKTVLSRQLLNEADDDFDSLPQVGDDAIPTDLTNPTPDDGSQEAAAAVGGQENLDELQPTNQGEDVIDRYIKSKAIAQKLDSAIATQLINRIEEIDVFVERLGGLGDDSLLSTLKRGAESNESIESIYDRERRAIGKVTGALSALSQNLKSYL